MLFDNKELYVYQIEESYIVATSEENAINKYKGCLLGYESENLEAMYCDLEQEGIHEYCDLDFAIGYISHLDNQCSVTITKLNDTYELFITFKDLIQESIDEEWFKNIENEPYFIAWNE